MTFSASFSSMSIVTLVSWLDNYVRNLINFVSFALPTSLSNLKDSDGLILAKTSAMRVSIVLVLSTRAFIPLPRTLAAFALVVPPLFSVVLLP